MTRRMKEHETTEVTLEAAAAIPFRSLSIAVPAPFAFKLPPIPAMKKSSGASGTGPALDGTQLASPALGGSERAKATAGKGEEEGVVSWETVKDPPLNVFASQHPGTAAGGTPQAVAPWLAVLRGTAGAEEDAQFVEIPGDPTQYPVDLSAAMVSLLSALYRSGTAQAPVHPGPASTPSAGTGTDSGTGTSTGTGSESGAGARPQGLPSSGEVEGVPLAAFMPGPEAQKLASLLAGTGNSSAQYSTDKAPSGVASGGSMGRQSSSDPYSLGHQVGWAGGQYLEALEVSGIPAQSRDSAPELEAQRLQAARIYR